MRAAPSAPVDVKARPSGRRSTSKRSRTAPASAASSAVGSVCTATAPAGAIENTNNPIQHAATAALVRLE